MDNMNYAYDLLKKYQPKKINDLSLINASLRPSGASYRDRLIAGEFNHNPSELIDDLLKDNNGFLVFQEDVIAFLQQICGLSGSDADNVRRAIGRKQLDRLEKAMPSILEGYCSKSDKPRNIAEEEAKEFLEIISNASNYMFGYNHSTGYSMLGYLCGYFRYYHPLEFITSYLNNANNDEDISTGTQLANQMGIKINSPKFGYSLGTYYPNSETNSIYKGIGSIKFCNENIGQELYDLRDNKYSTFLDLLIDITNKTSTNSRQLEILIKLNFFSEFGKTQKLLSIVNLYNKIYNKKQFKKDSLSDENIELIRKFASKETDKVFKEVDTQGLINHLIEKIPNKDISFKESLLAELDYLGYIDYKNDKIEKRYALVTDINTKYTPIINTYCLNNGLTCKCKINKKLWNNDGELNKNDVIYIHSMEKKFGWKKVGEKTDKKGNVKPVFEVDENKIEWHITNYSVIPNMEEVLDEIQ